MRCATAVIVLLMGLTTGVAWGTGSWPAIVDTNSTGTGLPDPWHDLDYGDNWAWGWLLTGEDGAYTGEAYARTYPSDHTSPDKDTGAHTAEGWRQKTQPEWSSGPANQCPCTHVAPTDAYLTSSYTADVEARFKGDANNGVCWPWPDGHVGGNATANIIFSGDAGTGVCEIKMEPSFKEGDTTVSGTISSNPSITITKTISSDKWDTSIKTDTWSGGGSQNPANISNKYGKVTGKVVVQAWYTGYPWGAEAYAKTIITTFNVTKGYGGTYKCANEQEPHGGH